MEADAYKLGHLDAALSFGIAREELEALTPKTAGVEFGGSIPISNWGGVGMSLKDQRERLPGMGKWVPRHMLERGFERVDEGLTPEEFVALEENRGSLTSPLLGAALAAGGAYRVLPTAGGPTALLAGLGGAGIGSLVHHLTKNRRRAEALDAYRGALRERQAFPVAKHPSQTANEASPIAVSRGVGE